MAAPTTTVPGKDLLLMFGGTALASARDTTLEVELDAPSVATKDSANWDETIAGARRWRLSSSGLYVESSAEIGGATGNVTIGGAALKGWDSLTLTMQCDLVDILNDTDGLDVKRAPKLRRAVLEVSGAYYDPAGTGHDANDDLWTEIMGGASAGVAVVMTFGAGQSVSFTGRPTRTNAGSPYDDQAPGSWTIGSTGSLTITDTNAHSTIVGLFTAFETAGAAASLSASFETATTGATEWSGTVFIRELRVGIPYAQPVTLDVALEGSGALVRGTTS